MAVILVIDTGGSKTAIQIRDSETDQVIYACTDVGFGTADEPSEPLPALAELLRRIAGRYPVSAAAVNLGGKNKAQLQNTLREVFPNIPAAVLRESEGDAACALGHATEAQVILLCGTGTIGIGVSPEGEKIVCGGWGMNIGDGGSGYDIGLTAIRRSLSALDQTDPLPLLAQKISGCAKPFAAVKDLSRIRDQRDAVRSRIFPLDRKKTASFAKLTAECAGENDPMALQILKEAGETLAALALSVAVKIGGEAVRGITLTGGLLHMPEFWQKAFEKRVRMVLPDVRFVYLPDGILDGAYYIAKQLLDLSRR